MDTKVFDRTVTRIQRHFSTPIHTDSPPVDMSNFQADPALAFIFKLSNELKLNIFERATYHDEGIQVKPSTSGPDKLDGMFSPVGIKLARTCKELQPLAMAAFLKVNVFHFSLDTRMGSGLVEDLSAVLEWLRGLGPPAQDVREIHAKSQRVYTPESLSRYLVKTRNRLHLGRVVEEILELTKANICLVFDGILMDSWSYGDPTVTIYMSRSQELNIVITEKTSHGTDLFEALIQARFGHVPVDPVARQREVAVVTADLMQACRVAFEEKLWDDKIMGSGGFEDGGDENDDDGDDDESGDEEMGDAEPADEEMHDSGSGEEEEEEQDEDQDGEEEGEGDDGGEQDSGDEEDQEEEEADNEEGDDEEDEEGDEEESEEQDDEDDESDDE